MGKMLLPRPLKKRAKSVIDDNAPLLARKSGP